MVRPWHSANDAAKVEARKAGKTIVCKRQHKAGRYSLYSVFFLVVPLETHC